MCKTFSDLIPQRSGVLTTLRPIKSLMPRNGMTEEGVYKRPGCTQQKQQGWLVARCLMLLQVTEATTAGTRRRPRSIKFKTVSDIKRVWFLKKLFVKHISFMHGFNISYMCGFCIRSWSGCEGTSAPEAISLSLTFLN